MVLRFSLTSFPIRESRKECPDKRLTSFAKCALAVPVKLIPVSSQVHSMVCFDIVIGGR